MMNKHKKIAIGFASLNLLAVILFILLATLGEAHAIIATVFATTALAILCTDMIYAAFSERFVLLRIILSTIAVIGNYGIGILVGTSQFADSFHVTGILLLILAYVGNGVLAILCAFAKQEPCEKHTFGNKLFPVLSLGAGACGLIAMFVAGIVLVATPTYASTNSVNVVPIMITLCTAFAALVISGIKPFHKKHLLSLIALGACMLCIVPYAITEGAAYQDAQNAEASFAQAFGDVQTQDGLRAPYNFSLEFTGIHTKNYTLERDKIYYWGNGEKDNLTLRYDAYYPATESKGVLVNLHGSGGDKDIGNYAHRNKYFASIGYTVFDIQYGDWNESGTGEVPRYDTTLEWAESHLYHLDEFIRFASASEKTADWSNLFLTGVSMGGTQVSRYALSYPNTLAETGAVLRGIIPVYPGYSSQDEGVLNCLSAITKDSTPCLVIMGDYDKVVSPQGADAYKTAYDNAGSPYCAQVKISFAGHGCDYFMAGRSNQLLTYYTAKFMQALRQ